MFTHIRGLLSVQSEKTKAQKLLRDASRLHCISRAILPFSESMCAASSWTTIQETAWPPRSRASAFISRYIHLKKKQEYNRFGFTYSKVNPECLLVFPHTSRSRRLPPSRGALRDDWEGRTLIEVCFTRLHPPACTGGRSPHGVAVYKQMFPRCFPRTVEAFFFFFF